MASWMEEFGGLGTCPDAITACWLKKGAARSSISDSSLTKKRGPSRGGRNSISGLLVSFIRSARVRLGPDGEVTSRRQQKEVEGAKDQKEFDGLGKKKGRSTS